MGEIWFGGVGGEKKAAAGSKAERRNKMDGDQMMRRRRFNFHLNNGTTTAAADLDGDEEMMMMKRKKMTMVGDEILCRGGESTTDADDETSKTSNCTTSTHDHMESLSVVDDDDDSNYSPKFGVTSVIGRRRDMEDAVAVHPSFCRKHRHPNYNIQARLLSLHYFGIYDGHGCSHVAMCCKKRMHEFVKEELERGDYEQCAGAAWKDAMDRSFSRMDREAIGTCNNNNNNNKASCTNYNSSTSTSCRCDLQMPDCDAVGSTAVVSIVTPDKIIVANCGDSRAVLCRAGKPLPLSNDHKVRTYIHTYIGHPSIHPSITRLLNFNLLQPDRPDELQRIQDAGGRVIFWDGPRVLGVLAMSRAIGDNYLKPYVSSEPEVTVTERSDNDDCLILASDGLWDVVSNDTACHIARMYQACSDAALLLTKLALARNSTDNVSVVIVDLRRTTTTTFNAC
ncbi:hypothetical protein Syun_015844 [Stephania yunnanensis]|uniref:protein-serine/threonine phosphatase n=1 Tax=Stephania yunnanensis TaxID=152371 RepID=A0AAP0J3N8_9MAGN